MIIPEVVECLTPVGGDGGAVSLIFEDFREYLRQIEIVFNYQNEFHVSTDTLSSAEGRCFSKWVSMRPASIFERPRI